MSLSGGVLDVYYILYFPHLLGGFLHICALYMYYICGLWPPDNVGCLFITEKSCYRDLLLVATVQTPPRHHQKSNFFNSDAFKKDTIYKCRHRLIIDHRFSP
jgi:hypothetical protein